MVQKWGLNRIKLQTNYNKKLKQQLHRITKHIRSTGRLNFAFGFGAEIGKNLIFGLVSAGCAAASFGFGQNCQWFLALTKTVCMLPSLHSTQSLMPVSRSSETLRLVH